MENRLLAVSKRKTKNVEEIKYSFSNAPLGQYTKQAVAYMQAQRFFVEHSFKEQKQILGMDQFQTRKWLPWLHQIALNMMVGFHAQREAVEPRCNTHTFGKGHNGFPVLQILQRNDRRTIA